MIITMELKGKTQQDIAEFIFKASPFSTPNTTKFANIVTNVIEDETYIHTESVGEVDNTDSVPKVKYFLVWRNYENTRIFAGTTFIPNTEAQQGIPLSKYEPPV